MKTRRRELLDGLLEEMSNSLRGKVIDIGGKKDNKRGAFRPPLSRVESWQYVNIDQATGPDICCSAESIPVGDESYEAALLCEVIEHLEQPEEVLREAYRILRRGGVVYISVPFLFPVHADPHDFQRWTDHKIISALSGIGFKDIRVVPMGGVGSVIHDLLAGAFNELSNAFMGRAARLLLHSSRWCFRLMDSALGTSASSITTGYFVTARKSL